MIETPEIEWFQVFGNFETLGSKFRYGISKKVATVRNHLRKGSKNIVFKHKIRLVSQADFVLYFETSFARTKFPSVAEPFPATAGVTM